MKNFNAAEQAALHQKWDKAVRARNPEARKQAEDDIAASGTPGMAATMRRMSWADAEKFADGGFTG